MWALESEMDRKYLISVIESSNLPLSTHRCVRIRLIGPLCFQPVVLKQTLRYSAVSAGFTFIRFDLTDDYLRILVCPVPEFAYSYGILLRTYNLSRKSACIKDRFSGKNSIHRTLTPN